MNFQINLQNKKGFTLFETILGLFLLIIIFSIVLGFALNFQKIVLINKIKFEIISILQNEMEKIRVLDYENIGIINGWPSGNLPNQKIIEKDGLQILVKYYVRNIDDPKDGTITSTPRDTAPADYKLVELEGSCLNCSVLSKTQTLTAIIAPKTIESRTQNGSLFIQVLNANGLPVSLANVRVEYLKTPNFIVEDLTDNTGFLRLIDIPPGINAYRIYVSKNNYSQDRTYQPGDPQNPNPVLSDQTVRAGELTMVTFKIDKLSILNLNFIDKFCQSKPTIWFTLQGTKLIGQNPDVFKTVITTTTDQNGKKTLSLEWDDYSFQINSSEYVIQGSIPYLKPKIYILPDKIYNYQITFTSSSPINVLITVLDPDRNYLQDAEVRLTKDNFSFIKYTGFEEIVNNDWSINYSEISSGIDISTGKIKLKESGGFYPTSSEWLISPTIDFGTSSIQFKNFSWIGNIPPGTSIKFQIAANNDNLTWNFIGPDGTSNSYFETNLFSLSQFNGNRFLRYKVYLQTTNSNLTPVLDEIKIIYSSTCLSPGQVIFQNLSPGNYNLEVLKQGFYFYNTSLNLSNNENFKEFEVNLLPF